MVKLQTSHTPDWKVFTTSTMISSKSVRVKISASVSLLVLVLLDASVGGLAISNWEKMTWIHFRCLLSVYLSVFVSLSFC